MYVKAYHTVFSSSACFVSLIFSCVLLEAKPQMHAKYALRRTDDFQAALKVHQEYNVDRFWLQHFLFPFTEIHCSVILRNFFNLDFIQTSIPLLTQYFEPMLETARFCEYLCVVWMASKFRSRSQFSEALTVLEDKPCESQYFLKYDRMSLRGSCVTINVTKWAFSGRQGNCKIIIDYALPEYMVANSSYSNSYPYSEDTLMHWTPLTLQINVLIQTLPKVLLSENPSGIENRHFFVTEWVRRSRVPRWDRRRSTISVYFLVTVEYLQTWNWRDVDEVTHTIYQLKPINFQPNLVKNLDWKRMKAQDLKFIRQNDYKEGNEWALDDSLSGDMRDSLEHCSTYSRIRMSQGLSTIVDRAARKADADAHVLQLIMGNFSYRVGYEFVCKYPGLITQGRLLQHKLASNVFVIDAYQAAPVIAFNSSLRDIRFVSWGNRGVSKLAFSQLLSNFDYQTWVCMCIACLLGAIIISQMQITKSWKTYENSAIQIFKAFVEQGNPFHDNVIKYTRLRLITISLMLAGIVLSNSYKNLNVYLMTQPRNVLRYDRVDQLLNDNISMYSRIGEARYIVSERLDMWWTRGFWVTPYFATSNTNPYVSIEYNVATFKARIKSKLESIQYGKGNPIVDRSHTQAIGPPPGSLETLKGLFDEFFGDKFTIFFVSVKKVATDYMRWEEKQLIDLLRSNNSTAVFLPEIIAVKYIKELQQGGNQKRFTISKQAFHNEPAGIKFGGLISSSLLERAAWIKQSGILSKWKYLFDFDLNMESSLDREELSAVKMSGNVVIHFAVLLIGLSLGCVAFGLERSIASIQTFL